MNSSGWARLLRSRRVNDRGNFGDSICGEASLPGMPPNHLFIWCVVYAIDLIASHIDFRVRLDSLDLTSRMLESESLLLGDQKNRSSSGGDRHGMGQCLLRPC